MINSVCLCITFRCNLHCRHCFISAGPENIEEMTEEQIITSIDNSYNNVYRIWFSGGEPTVVMDKLLFALRYTKNKQKLTGFPKRICVQTNGSFATSVEKAIQYLFLLHNNGANEIDISSNDAFHFEFMDRSIPYKLAEIANKSGMFEQVTIGGSEYKAVKRIGRAANISGEELKTYDLDYLQRCVYTGSDYVIHPNGNVLLCIYGFSNVLGNVFSERLCKIIDSKRSKEIRCILQGKTIQQLFLASNKRTTYTDICHFCNDFFTVYREEIDTNA